MAKLRVYELARELEMDNRDLMVLANRLGVAVKNHASTLDEEQQQLIIDKVKGVEKPVEEKLIQKPGTKVIRRRRKVQDGMPDTGAETDGDIAAEDADMMDTGDALAAEDSRTPEVPAAPEPEPVAEVEESADSPDQQVGVGIEVSASEASRQTPDTGDAGTEAEPAAPQDADALPVTQEAPESEAGEDLSAAQEMAAVSEDAEAAEPQEASGPRIKQIILPKPKQVSKIVGRIDITPEVKRKPLPRPEVRRVKPAKRVAIVGGATPIEETPAAIPAPGEKQRDPKKKSDAYQDKPSIGGHRKRKVVDDLYPERLKRINKKKKRPDIMAPMTASTKTVKVAESILVSELGRRMGIKGNDVVKMLFGMGMMVTVNQVIDFDTATLVASEFDCAVEFSGFEEDEILKETPDTLKDMEHRPPVVTVMGHVDHGKTSILDAIRNTNVTDSEAGGITQHIGAYLVNLSTEKVQGAISFIDTPGHEAFTAMRARGARITDIVILVVAADDGVMPQTVEAINHAKAAGVPIIVAINKIDKNNADPSRVRTDLMRYGLVSEEMGGDTQMIEVSAKKRINIEGLLEQVLVQAEMMELTANPNKNGQGVVVEAKLDRGRGPVATFLVQQGTIRVGDYVVCGPIYGRIRSLTDDKNKQVKAAGPSMPVEVIGLEAVPDAGESFAVVSDERKAKQVTSHRSQKQREALLAKAGKQQLEQMFKDIDGDKKTLNLIIKGDVQGSIEALTDAFVRMSSEEVTVEAIHSGVGGITENDVRLASASKALIIGFNVRPESKVAPLAQRQGVEIRQYSIIYDAVEDLQRLMTGMIDPQFAEKVTGRALVRQIFHITKVGTIAGCVVEEGKVLRKAKARLLRDSAVVFEGDVQNLKHFKDDAKEVNAGQECGISLANYNDIKPGDIIETYILESVTPTLTPLSEVS